MPREKVIRIEGDVKKKLIQPWYVAHAGWSFMPVKKNYGVNGIPDHVGCIPIEITQAMVGKTFGFFVAIEAKAPGKRNDASKHQHDKLVEIRAARGVGEVVSCATDLREVEEIVQAIKEGEYNVRPIYIR